MGDVFKNTDVTKQAHSNLSFSHYHGHITNGVQHVMSFIHEAEIDGVRMYSKFQINNIIESEDREVRSFIASHTNLSSLALFPNYRNQWKLEERLGRNENF